MENKPAFPRNSSNLLDNGGLPVPGISIRQFYKAAALQGELSCQSETAGFNRDFHLLSIRCGDIADAMLAEDEVHEAKGKP